MDGTVKKKHNLIKSCRKKPRKKTFKTLYAFQKSAYIKAYIIIDRLHKNVHTGKKLNMCKSDKDVLMLTNNKYQMYLALL